MTKILDLLLRCTIERILFEYWVGEKLCSLKIEKISILNEFERWMNEFGRLMVRNHVVS